MEKKAAEARPYHHGDLRRGLIEAAERILEREGPSALSLRAVAREAGVSAAAPYHHFKDKDELLAAIAHQGYDQLAEAMRVAADREPDPIKRINALGVAYVRFARDNQALYHLMYDSNRRENFRVEPRKPGEGPTSVVMQAFAAMTGVEDVDPLEMEVRQLAGWCLQHGLAEMAASREFDSLKARLGGEEAFYSAILSQLVTPGQK